MNTMFPKENKQLATYRPMKASKTEEITNRTHEQLDYTMTRDKD